LTVEQVSCYSKKETSSSCYSCSNRCVHVKYEH
jgi:hypothetical protein